MSDGKEIIFKLEDFKIEYGPRSMEISHPLNNINSILDKKFLPYNYIILLQEEIKRLNEIIENK